MPQEQPSKGKKTKKKVPSCSLSPGMLYLLVSRLFVAFPAAPTDWPCHPVCPCLVPATATWLTSVSPTDGGSLSAGTRVMPVCLQRAQGRRVVRDDLLSKRWSLGTGSAGRGRTSWFPARELVPEPYCSHIPAWVSGAWSHIDGQAGLGQVGARAQLLAPR